MVVLKFGGTSVGKPERMKKIAELVTGTPGRVPGGNGGVRRAGTRPGPPAEGVARLLRRFPGFYRNRGSRVSSFSAPANTAPQARRDRQAGPFAWPVLDKRFPQGRSSPE